MSQKSILSFFKQTDKSLQSNKSNDSGKLSLKSETSKESAELNGHNEKEGSAADCSNSSKKQNGFELTENDSPIKQGKKRKTRLIDSDEESNQSQNGVSNTVKNESEKMEVDDSQEVGESLQSNNSSTKLIGKQLLSSEDSLQNAKESSSKKIKLEGNSPGKTNVLSNLSDSRVNSQSPSSSVLCNRNSKLPPPPKRKTARKSMKASNAIETSFEEDSTKQFPSIETYEEEVVKKDSSTKDENKTSKIKSDDIEESKEESSEKITSSKKPQAIHPFFAKKESPVKSKNVSESEKEEEKNSSSDGESESKKNNKNPDDSEKVDESSNEKAKKKTVNSSSSGVHYDPSKSKYHPIEDACWKRNEKVPYLALAKTLEFIENTSARLKIVEILANYFRSVIVLTPDDLLQSVYLCLNRIAPEYEGIELGVGDMVLMKAVAQATGRTLDKIRAEVKEKGDLGLVAESSRGNQKVMFAPPKLTVASVFSKFKEIAKMSGNAAMAKKTDKIQTLFVACRDCEAKYIIRSLSGKLRIGLAEQSVLAALGRAVVLTPPGQTYPPDKIDTSSGMSSEKFKKLQDEKTLILKTTYCECPNYDLMIPVLLKEGIDRLSEHCQLSPGCPLKPMLAHPTTGIDEVLQRFVNNDFTCEFKYDGERAQIHRTDKGEVKIFSRNQEDNTSKYPDIIARISKALKDTTKSFILDTEAVAWDHEMKQILPFQILSTRKKKDAAKSEIVVQVCVMAFDLLYLNGESLVKKPLKERRELLHSSFDEVPNEFMFVTYKDGNSAETMQEFLDESIKGNCEGLMVKALKVDASYEIAKRSHNWLKLKKDYLNGVGDTLDLVVIGGYHGKGKRTGTYGGFLLACYDNDNEEFQSICKLGTGFKEDELEAHTKFLKNHVISAPKSYYRFDHSLEPDEWFEPEQIWEVKCADLSISPIHKAAIGIVDPEKGISLRFPRFLKIRDDKKVEEATNSSQIAEMYRRQDQVQNMKAKPKNEENYY